MFRTLGYESYRSMVNCFTWKHIQKVITIIILPWKQWVAETTQWGETSEPPQKCVSLKSRATCQGHAPCALWVPPTIRRNRFLVSVRGCWWNLSIPQERYSINNKKTFLINNLQRGQWFTLLTPFTVELLQWKYFIQFTLLYQSIWFDRFRWNDQTLKET